MGCCTSRSGNTPPDSDALGSDSIGIPMSSGVEGGGSSRPRSLSTDESRHSVNDPQAVGPSSAISTDGACGQHAAGGGTLLRSGLNSETLAMCQLGSTAEGHIPHVSADVSGMVEGDEFPIPRPVVVHRGGAKQTPAPLGSVRTTSISSAHRAEAPKPPSFTRPPPRSFRPSS